MNRKGCPSTMLSSSTSFILQENGLGTPIAMVMSVIMIDDAAAEVLSSSTMLHDNDAFFLHLDFYPNEGLAPQPGCEGRESLDLSCSHRKAWQMYMESIQKDKPKFFAIECTDAQAFAKGYCCHGKSMLKMAIMGEVSQC